MKIKEHKLLGDEYYSVEFTQAKSYSNKKIQQKYIVLHFTAGVSYDKSKKTLTEGDVSAHFLVSRTEKKIGQFVDTNLKAWHAGKSTWNGLVGMNSYAIGIEIDNAGKLKKIGPDKWKTWYGKPIEDENEVYEHSDGTFWHAYPKQQIETLIDLLVVLCKEYNIPANNIIRHEDICIPKGRKVDTGPALDLDLVRKLVDEML